MASNQLQTAITAVKSGQRIRGRTLLLEIVEQDPHNELAWLWLSVVVDDLEDQIIALENAFTINPDRLQTQTRLAKLKAKASVHQFAPPRQQNQQSPAVPQDPLAAGRYHEQQGNLEKARDSYQLAIKQAADKTERRLAKNRLKAVKARLKKSRVIKNTSPFVTLGRLSLGPPLLYGLLIFMQSGLNPVQIPITGCLGGMGVILGSLLIVSGQYIPRDPLWQRFFGDEGLTSQNRFLVIILGLLLLIIPFMFLGFSAINRLEVLSAAWGLSS